MYALAIVYQDICNLCIEGIALWGDGSEQNCKRVAPILFTLAGTLNCDRRMYWVVAGEKDRLEMRFPWTSSVSVLSTELHGCTLFCLGWEIGNLIVE